MELVFILAKGLSEMLFIDLFKVAQIVRAFGIYTFMQDEMLPVFLWNQSVTTVWAAQFHRGKAVIFRGELSITDFAKKLSLGAVVLIKKEFGSATTWTVTVVRNITIGAPVNGFDFFTIAFFVIRDQVFVSPLLFEISNERKLINFKLLVFRGVGVIKCPLLKRDVSANKI